MATARDVTARALRLAGVLAAGETATAEDAQDALAALNGMMHGLELEGVRLGHSTLTLDDDLALPPSHIEALTWMLATRLVTEFGLDMRVDVATLAGEREIGLRAAYAVPLTSVADPAYGDTLAGWRRVTW